MSFFACFSRSRSAINLSIGNRSYSALQKLTIARIRPRTRPNTAPCSTSGSRGAIQPFLPKARNTEAVLAILGPDEFCGEGCLTGHTLRLTSAVAITQCEILRIEKAAIIRVLHEEPAFSEMFIAHQLARTIRVEADLIDQLFNSTEKR